MLGDKEALARLVQGDLDLQREKFTLAQIVADEKFVNTRVLVYLRNTNFHNLPKVRELYKVALDIDIFAILGKEMVAALFKAVEYRHDCVHRNGVGKDGKRLEVFTRGYIGETADEMKHLVEVIEALTEAVIAI